MKAFLVGLVFLVAVLIFSVIGYLIFPLLLVLGVFLKFIISAALILLAIWFLGKSIIFVWESIKEK